LNHFEDLKRWLRGEQKFNEWQHLEMQWIQGHNPDLVVLDESGREKERIDLTQYSYTQMSDLLRSKGFRMKGED